MSLNDILQQFRLIVSFYLYNFLSIIRPYSAMIASLATIAGVVLFLINLLLLRRVIRIGRQLPNQPADSTRRLEDAIYRMREDIGTLSHRLSDLEAFREQRERQCPGCIQGIGIVKFNAFHGMGGEQSFSLALVDGNGNGVIITALHGRDESCIYAKPLESGSSPYPLSDEERAAIAKAIHRT
ncbi:MAG TPA: DUF4446 family protein [Firmicutes bacterium]|nr:DUF4446 family protein [Bacillota bacterium]